MKNFKTILLVTLILDVLQSIPVFLAVMGGEIKNQFISDFNIEGLASSSQGIAVLDLMLYVFAFIFLGVILSVIYTMRLKTLDGLKSACFVLFIIHLFWTLPDFIALISGGSAHPPIIIMIISIIPVVGLYYVSQKGELRA